MLELRDSPGATSQIIFRLSEGTFVTPDFQRSYDRLHNWVQGRHLPPAGRGWACEGSPSVEAGFTRSCVPVQRQPLYCRQYTGFP